MRRRRSQPFDGSTSRTHRTGLSLRWHLTRSRGPRTGPPGLPSWPFLRSWAQLRPHRVLSRSCDLAAQAVAQDGVIVPVKRPQFGERVGAAMACWPANVCIDNLWRRMRRNASGRRSQNPIKIKRVAWSRGLMQRSVSRQAHPGHELLHKSLSHLDIQL